MVVIMKLLKYLTISILFCSSYLAYSQGIDWQSINQGSDLNYTSVTYGNGLYVAVASSGVDKRVMTSPDSKNWTARNTPSENQWQSVTFGNGLFVAVSTNGSGNRVMSSSDGINWTLRTSAADNQWQSVTFGNGLFVAVAKSGTGNRVMTSPDGIIWTSRTSAADMNWSSVTYGKGLFIAVASSGSGNRVMSSPDGITWTSRAASENIGWFSVTYGNNLFVAVAGSGVGNRIMTSSDGITWQAGTPAAQNSWRSITYGNGVFVAVAIDGTGNRIMTSTDGLQWNSRLSAADNNWVAVTYGNGYYVAVANSGAGNRIMSSTDGITWNALNTAADNQWRSVTYGKNIFVAVSCTGSGNRVMTSPDGCTWTPRASAADNLWTSVVYGNGLFVAVAIDGADHGIMTSPDGITWTSRTSAADNAWTSVTFGNGLFVAVASSGTGNRVMTSPDGINWTSRSSTADNAWSSVTYGNGLFVAVAKYGTEDLVMTSSDGIVWTSRKSASTNQWYALTYGNGLYVAAATSGSGDRIMSSPDGINWTSRSSAADYQWVAITYGNGLFVAVANDGRGNKVMTSPDGIIWTSRNSGSDNSWFGVTYGNNRFVAVSSNGTNNRVMISTCSQPASPTASMQSFCASDQPTVLNLIASGQDLKWYATETDSNSLSSNTALRSGTYYVSQTINGCESSRKAVVVTVTTCAIMWTGAINNTWSIAGNWSNNQVPDGTLDIEIPKGTPTLDIPFTLTKNAKLTVSGSGTLTIAPNASITIQGLANFNDLPITLKSDKTGTAVIGQVTGTILGATNVTVENFIAQGKKAFHLLSSGVTTRNFISNNWQLATPIVGVGTSASGFDTAAVASPSLFKFNNNQSVGNGWSTITATNNTNLEIGNGYRMMVLGDRNANINNNESHTMNSCVTLKATGNLAIGTIVFDSKVLNSTTNQATNGYSLIGNPYVNTVNWSTLSKEGLTESYYVWDPNMGTDEQRGRYVVYNSATGSSNIASGVNGFIAPGQAFFVQNKILGIAGKLTFREADKVGNINFNQGSRTQPILVSRIDMSVYEASELSTGGYPIDAAVAVFDAAFNNAIDNTDVVKLSSGTENFSITNNNKFWAIDTRGLISDKDEVFLNLEDFKANKNYSFRIQFSNFDTQFTPFLVDTHLGTKTKIPTDEAAIINFSTTTAAASYKNDRFKIIFENKTLDTEEFTSDQIVFYPNPVTNNQFNLTLPTIIEGDLKIQLISILGQTVYELQTQAKPELNIIIKKELPQGVYLAKISHQNINLIKKITIN